MSPSATGRSTAASAIPQSPPPQHHNDAEGETVSCESMTRGIRKPAAGYRHIPPPYTQADAWLVARRPTGRTIRVDRRGEGQPDSQTGLRQQASSLPYDLGTQLRLGTGPRPRLQPAHHTARHGDAVVRRYRVSAARIPQGLGSFVPPTYPTPHRRHGALQKRKMAAAAHPVRHQQTEVAILTAKPKAANRLPKCHN